MSSATYNTNMGPNILLAVAQELLEWKINLYKN